MERHADRGERRYRRGRGQQLLPAGVDRSGDAEGQRDDERVSMEGHRALLHAGRRRRGEPGCGVVLSGAKGRGLGDRGAGGVLEGCGGALLTSPSDCGSEIAEDRS